MVINRFTLIRGGETTPADTNAADLPQPERFQTEVYKAIEILGRKLERSEAEREKLAARLAQIESSATLDQETGRLYLPAIVEKTIVKDDAATVSASGLFAMSLCIFLAFFTLGVQVMKPPQAPVQIGTVLSKDQLAALDMITMQHMSGLLTGGVKADEWQHVDTTAPAAPQPEAIVATETTPAATEPAVAIQVPMPAVTESEAPSVAPAETAKPAAKTETPAYVTIARDEALPKKFARLEDRAFDGVSEAQHDLAALYAAGKAVPQDYKRAAYWFSRAADGGIGNAHYNLGVMFQQGLGVRKDMKKALSWYKSAAELGHPEAMFNLGIAYTDGVGVKQNAQRGASYFKRAATAGIAQAAYNLGVLYESGFLGKPDMKQAVHWYQDADKKGQPEAKKALQRLK